MAADRATIERIGAREGWRTEHHWRGPKGMKIFELYEVWVENRIMLELVTPDMVPAYAAIARGEAVMVNDKFGVRLTEIVSQTERVERLK